MNFWCVAYAQLPEVKRKKLDDCSGKYIFIVYGEESKAYKLYNPLTKKLVVSGDVILNEKNHETGAKKKQPKCNSWRMSLMISTGGSRATPPSPQHATPSSTKGYLPFGESNNNGSIMTKVHSKLEASGISLNRQKMERLIFSAYIDHEPLTFQEAIEEIVGDQ